jgi:recombination protein RecR
MQNEFNGLLEYFKQFPGIGRRQAERFCYFVLSKDENWTNNFIKELQNTRKNVYECTQCFRVFKHSTNINNNKFCKICADQNRNKNILAVFEKNIDLESFLSKTKYDGLVFVLGGNIPVIEKKNRNRIKIQELLNFIKILSPLLDKGEAGRGLEIILCTSVTADGIFTANILRDEIKKLEITNLKITTFGRGFSTGTELEYVDKETLEQALKHREIL